MYKETFADRLKSAMDSQSLKQIDLVRAAEEQGIKLGKSHISQYVSGKTVPRAEILRFLAGELHVGEDWLTGKEALERSKVSGDAAVSGGKEMREFKKSSKLEHVLYDVRGPVVEEAARMEGEGTQILKLNIGNPAPFGFRTPDEVIYDMRQQLTECEGYSSAKGLFFCQEGDHAVCTDQEAAECFNRGYLYRKRCQ